MNLIIKNVELRVSNLISRNPGYGGRLKKYIYPKLNAQTFPGKYPKFWIETLLQCTDSVLDKK